MDYLKILNQGVIYGTSKEACAKTWFTSFSSTKKSFIYAGFKAGMTHITFIENQPNSPYYGKELMKPVTIIEAPPLILIGIRLYSEDEYGKYVEGEIFSPKLNENLRKIRR